jgi:hypothetical protein
MVDITHPDSDNTAMIQLRLALERELHPNETVQWHGWQIGRIDPRHFLGYVFAVPWTAFSLAWTGIAFTAVLASEQTGLGLFAWAFPLFGLPFVPLWERGRVLYVVTDRRALKLSSGRQQTITTAPGDRIGLVQRREWADGSGTLSLAIRVGRDSYGDRQTESFDIGLVADVIGAQAAIDRIADGARPPGGGTGTLSS